MKNQRHPKRTPARAADKRPRPALVAPAPSPSPAPKGPPLAGEALEMKVAEKMCEGFRATQAREELRTACGGAEQTAIEAAIVSPRVKSIVEPVSRAFALEESVAVIRLLLTNARAALTADKPTPAQILALKIVFETIVEKILSGIGGSLWQESFSLLGFSDYEKSLIENLVLLVRGQRSPVDDPPQPAPEICASAGNGE